MDNAPVMQNDLPFYRIKPEEWSGGNPQISGIFEKDVNVYVNAIDFYDANGVNHQDHAVIGPDRNQEGFFRAGGARAAGWMNKTPEKWVSDIGPYYMGHASNWPINGRLSQGPSLYGWDGNTPPTTREFLYYSLNNPLGSHDAENPANPLWNELSHAAVGFIHGDD